MVKVDDTIEFSNTDDAENTIRVKVVALHHFYSFDQLYFAFPLEKCGYDKYKLTYASPRDMEQYYSPEEQKKYGVLAIEVELAP